SFFFSTTSTTAIYTLSLHDALPIFDDEQALLIGIECERGSHEFFKKYGEHFEDSEGKEIFLEFADEERAHLELLTREYHALIERDRKSTRLNSSHVAISYAVFCLKK